MGITKRKNNTYNVEVYSGGIRVAHKRGFRTKEEAQAYHDRIKFRGKFETHIEKDLENYTEETPYYKSFLAHTLLANPKEYDLQILNELELKQRVSSAIKTIKKMMPPIPIAIDLSCCSCFFSVMNNGKQYCLKHKEYLTMTDCKEIVKIIKVEI